MNRTTILIIASLIFIPIIIFALNFFNILAIPQRKTKLPEIKTGQDLPLLSVVAKNLEVPWALAFLPNGQLLVTERPGRVRLIDTNGNLISDPVSEIEAVKTIGEGGLLGIALHPQFSVNRYVYLYYTFGESGSQTLNRVSRFNFDDQDLSQETVVVDNIPGNRFHNGGRLKFGPDGYLYVTTGDAQDPSQSQDTNSLAGKILRVDENGNPASGNPFNNRVYSYGHRNPQGITWDDSGRLWETEHSQSATDELNLIEIGKNYGWPTIRGDQSQQGLVSPVKHSGSDTWAPAGAAYLNGSIYFVGLRGQALYQAKINGQSVTLVEHLKNQLGRLREVVVGPDNMLYITTSNRDGRGVTTADDDKIVRVNPEKL